ncbi:hypothetical protein RhiirC2_744427 [Rhizophagus irregularis]|uniref:Uncharacterized protein n=1 Tax=Rhizophagus irregularis TaxID=588596 RepID=A0A2N1NCE4_9GLOM|nr:hypothetical protein RhiirC2_744427 [Rhizophagus irregularis]
MNYLAQHFSQIKVFQSNILPYIFENKELQNFHIPRFLLLPLEMDFEDTFLME